jgi:hypothetical protein
MVSKEMNSEYLGYGLITCLLLQHSNRELVIIQIITKMKDLFIVVGFERE